MPRILRRSPLTCLIMLALAPLGASGQFGSPIAMTDVRPTSGFEACMMAARTNDGTLRDVLDTRLLQQDQARPRLLELQEALSAEAGAQPDDIDAQYALAAVLGSRAEVESGRTRVRAAQAMHSQALHVLSLDPDHAGAHYLMGRLHAGVMRMDRITRFVATRLLGGGALAGASWAEARTRLESAVLGDPCVPDHHYELARLYAERGNPELAIAQLEQLGRLRKTAPFAEVFASAEELLADLRPRSAGSD